MTTLLTVAVECLGGHIFVDYLSRQAIYDNLISQDDHRSS